ncbi:hypothetical protein HJG52_20055 [Knoellia sp. DB2414S]|uniref:Uncharacterized protein n=1 Tax=Knoellia koreensis TaxID=2730921 RepID=A0A849HEV8_9MICO|nr:hypothetical protein [Knoellia sp. DB2414S]
MHTLGGRLTDHLAHQLDGQCDRVRSLRRPHGPGDRGSVTIEQVIWAVAVIAIVGIVVAAVKSYVATQAGNIR